ncbi:hypothetical protein B0H66DRAFT_346094 [Apodospora peruviana]|uniref:Uncharacterized protein n=1 Tax=Apodospora peruviana TaxID=516989 RepID=A0AAE0HYW9_9PEZI|nr:hypothetical protein B0H66DRAFT_346094 [Apodospora peruviana]
MKVFEIYIPRRQLPFVTPFFCGSVDIFSCINYFSSSKSYLPRLLFVLYFFNHSYLSTYFITLFIRWAGCGLRSGRERRRRQGTDFREARGYVCCCCCCCCCLYRMYVCFLCVFCMVRELFGSQQ